MSDQAKRRRFQRLERLADGPYVAVTILYSQWFLRLYPDHGPAWARLGTALVEVARYEEAENAFSNALRTCPADKQHIVLGQLGHLWREAGDFDLAAAWYRKATAAAPREAGNYIYLGAVLAKQGRLTEAESAHRAAADCTEGCVDEAYLNLGYVLRAQERFEEAADCMRKAIELDSNYREARRALRDLERAIIARQRYC